MAKRWTKEEDASILKLRGEGLSALEIASRTRGRTVGAVKMRLSHLAPESINRIWTEEEKVLAVALRDSGSTIRSIAKQLGRTPAAISTFLSRNGFN